MAYLLWVCIFYSLSFFLTCRSMWHTFFGYTSFYFLIAPYPWCHFLMREMSYGNMEFLIGGCMSGYVANFQCRSVACGSGHVCDLDHWSMKWISLRVTTIWQSSMKLQVAYVEGFAMKINIWLGIGISYHRGTLLYFYIFKD